MAELETRDGRIVETRKSSTPVWLLGILVIVGVVVAAFALGFIDIDQTKTAQLPDVKVETQGGQAPAFDVETAKVDVGSKETTIEVPTISVEKAGEKK